MNIDTVYSKLMEWSVNTTHSVIGGHITEVIVTNDEFAEQRYNIFE